MPDPLPSHVTVVGLGADGWAGLSPQSRSRVSAAEVVVGSSRQLGLLPDVAGQQRRTWPSPLTYDLLADHADRPVVVLASGDPLVSGIATSLARVVGADRVEVLPAVSSVSLARARMVWDAESSEVVTVVGRRVEAVLRHLAPDHRVLVLSSDETTPATLAGLLVDAGYGATRMTVLGDLGADDESRTEGVAATWSAVSPRLNVVALDCRGPVVGSWVAGLPDEAFEHDGQLTKRDLRACALARLAPQPGQVLLDLGAGAGSVGIEWMRAHPTCATVAVERDPARAERIARNAGRLGVPGLRVECGDLDQVLPRLGPAHAVFVGGGATAPGLLDRCRASLRPGGRLVVHGVTLETELVLGAQYADHGGELTRIAVETAAPIGSFTGWSPARTVTQWSWTAPVEDR
ncbi:precorrin-6y C5,15-methyltransferase (decarboxylating) subunit CbiE [Nocardioides rubriscoriae]|uniref:precorrin-6y C5,15-methyltransferase (decarboxylating) subunit CbiE n=1 Tax=Nocardioides rubriscoriae TaxID=642762 RepID=UPI001FE29AC8|nr:precorrin-6y C5,15-methyltransferase (decarboxylating) subunit CbiE [Nocardioides rubriscoriae]